MATNTGLDCYSRQLVLIFLEKPQMAKAGKIAKKGGHIECVGNVVAYRSISRVAVYVCLLLVLTWMTGSLRAEDGAAGTFGRINFPIWFEYNGVYCGQLGATWVPGTIGRKKRFTPYYLKVRYINRTIRKTADTVTRQSLLSCRTRIQELMRQHTIACSVGSQQRS
jgi:hypothetical protein